MDEPQQEPPEVRKPTYLDGELTIDQDGDGDFWLRIGGYPVCELHPVPETWKALQAFYHRGSPLGDRLHKQLYGE